LDISHWTLVINSTVRLFFGRDHDQFRFAPTQGQVIAAHFDFQGVAQWGEPNQFDRRPNQQAHLEETGTMFGSDFDFGDCRKTADGEASERGSAGILTLLARGRQRFDQNGFGQLIADRQAGIADQANQIMLAAQKPDVLLLANP